MQHAQRFAPIQWVLSAINESSESRTSSQPTARTHSRITDDSVTTTHRPSDAFNQSAIIDQLTDAQGNKVRELSMASNRSSRRSSSHSKNYPYIPVTTSSTEMSRPPSYVAGVSEGGIELVSRPPSYKSHGTSGASGPSMSSYHKAQENPYPMSLNQTLTTLPEEYYSTRRNSWQNLIADQQSYAPTEKSQTSRGRDTSHASVHSQYFDTSPTQFNQAEIEKKNQLQSDMIALEAHNQQIAEQARQEQIYQQLLQQQQAEQLHLSQLQAAQQLHQQAIIQQQYNQQVLHQQMLAQQQMLMQNQQAQVAQQIPVPQTTTTTAPPDNEHGPQPLPPYDPIKLPSLSSTKSKSIASKLPTKADPFSTVTARSSSVYCNYSKANCTKTLFGLLVVYIFIGIGFAVAMVLKYYSTRYYFQWVPPQDMVWNTIQTYKPTTIKLHIDKPYNRGVFSAYGDYPIKYIYTVADFNGRRFVHTLKEDRFRNYCFVHALNETAMRTIFELELAANNAEQEVAVTSPEGTWREKWTWGIEVVGDFDIALYDDYGEIGGCDDKTIVRFFYSLRALQKHEQCQQCTQVCLPEYGVWNNDPSMKNSLTVLSRLCAWVYIPETTTACSQYAPNNAYSCKSRIREYYKQGSNIQANLDQAQWVNINLGTDPYANLQPINQLIPPPNNNQFIPQTG